MENSPERNITISRISTALSRRFCFRREKRVRKSFFGKHVRVLPVFTTKYERKWYGNEKTKKIKAPAMFEYLFFRAAE